MTLLDHLARVPDPRSRHGRRYPLSPLLAGTIMALLCGHAGYRPIARFFAANVEDLRRSAGWPADRPPPSNVTVRAVLRALDFAALSAEFRVWATERLPNEEVLALDAKAIRSTVSDHESAEQDFAALVSAYGAASGLTAAAVLYRSKAQSEVHAAQGLIAELAAALDLTGQGTGRGLTGKIVTLDALHCVKKRSLRSPTPAGIGS
ncbi:hypothetical protein LzC2_42150 [Planctomycetes bacterium LzC2]|uniref:H repeat-associated protein N-terminal domain-containing protein n=1 Tax=Alienimonas chondri TaxID=2681879 RepID=A0ABX1VJQ1_9PLAN|nr:ISAs1 family transposase [Alienimonas chondri]NNJ28104.1 hypothetical protein [Alienimonas chondri]